MRVNLFALIKYLGVNMDDDNLKKLSKIGELRSNVNEFMEFCNSKGVYLFDADNPHTSVNSDDILFEMFDIDKVELEQERQALVTSIQKC